MKKITLLCLMFLTSFAVSAQCINGTSFLNPTATNNGSVEQIATCTYSTEYNTISGLIIGDDYEFVATAAGVDAYVTITDLTDTVIAFGPSPLAVPSITSTDVRLHVTADETCAGGSVCHVTSFQNTSVTCFQPTALTATNITTSGADLGWTESGTASLYNVEVVDVTGGGTQTMTPTATGVANPYGVSGLEAGNDYEFYVQADCGGTDGVSGWSGPFSFTTVANCVDPSGLAISNVTSVSAQASWTENGTASVYNVELVDITAGGTQTMTATEAGVSNPHTFTGLSPQNDYEYYVLADCSATGGTGVSQWVGPFAFTTACVAAAAPYTETFETFTVSSADFTNENCWSATVATGGYNWEVAATTDTSSSGTGPGSGVSDGNYLFTEATTATAGTSVDLVSPLVDLSTLTAPSLSFDYHMFGGDMGTLDVLVNGTDNVFSISGQQQLENDPFLTGIIDLSAYAGQTISVTFRVTRGPDFESDLAIDTVSFDEAPSCIAPAGNGTVVLDCDSSMFSIDVEVTSLGSATTVNIFDGTNSIPVSATGVTTVGPYAFGSSINITLVHDTDNTCDNDLGAFTDFACPPANDECSNAIELTVNEDLNCTELTNGTIAAATNSGIDTCGGTEDDDVWYSFVATNETHTVSLINVTGSTTDLYHAVYDADPGCGALGTALTCSDPNDSTTSGLTVGNTYYVQVYSWTSTGGQTSVFDICIGTPPAPPANDDCAAAEALTVNTDGTCTITTSGTLESSTESSIDPSCDTGTEWDVWYSFVAPSSGNIDFTVTLGTGNPLEYAVFDDCAGTTQLYCSDPLDGTSLTGLTPGTTYYLMVWNDGFETPGDFTICASEPTCTPSTATYTVVNDCDNSGGFLIDVEITDMGSATNLTVSNDQDATTFPATSTGTIVQFGPYTNGTDVIITVSDDSDANCSYDSSAITQVACPPSNDDIANATAITIGEMICDGSTNNGSNVAATDSGEGAGSCFFGGAGSDVWYTFTISSDSDVTVSTDYLGGTLVDTQIAVYSGTPGALVEEGCSQDEGTVILSNGSSWNSIIPDLTLTAGTYYVQVSGYNGAEGTFCLSVDAVSLSTEDFDKEAAFTYYPNPVNNNLNLSSQKEINNVSVYNMVGQEVYRSTPNTMTDVVDMSGLQAGAYFVKVTVGNATKTVKVIKK